MQFVLLLLLLCKNVCYNKASWRYMIITTILTATLFHYYIFKDKSKGTTNTNTNKNNNNNKNKNTKTVFLIFKSILDHMAIHTFDDIPFNNSLLFPKTVKNFDFNIPMAGVRPIKLLIRDVSPTGGGVAGCDGDELNILTSVFMCVLYTKQIKTRVTKPLVNVRGL